MWVRTGWKPIPQTIGLDAWHGQRGVPALRSKTPFSRRYVKGQSVIVIDLLLRLTHIFSAVFLAGGVFFMWCALLPSLSVLPDEQRKALHAQVRSRWSKVVMITSGLLLISGLINAVNLIRAYDFSGVPGQMYHLLVMVKLLLALGVFWISATLSGRSETAEKFRQKAPFWINVNAMLLICLIVVAGLMRTSERTPKTPETPPVAKIEAE